VVHVHGLELSSRGAEEVKAAWSDAVGVRRPPASVGARCSESRPSRRDPPGGEPSLALPLDSGIGAEGLEPPRATGATSPSPTEEYGRVWEEHLRARDRWAALARPDHAGVHATSASCTRGRRRFHRAQGGHDAAFRALACRGRGSSGPQPGQDGAEAASAPRAQGRPRAPGAGGVCSSRLSRARRHRNAYQVRVARHEAAPRPRRDREPDAGPRCLPPRAQRR
jgi:hypothetical protein